MYSALRWLLSSDFFAALIAIIAVNVAPNLLFAATELELNEDDSIIVEMRYKRFLMTDAMFLYHSTEYSLIALQEFSDGMEYSITVDPETMKASGWFVNPSNTLELNVQENTVHLRGERHALPDSFQYFSDGFDIYVSKEYLEKWFDIEIIINMARLAVHIKSDKNLPIDERVLRERVRDKNTVHTVKAPTYPRIPNTYHWLSPPSIDAQVFGTRRKETNEQLGFSLQSAGDLIKHETRLSLSQSNQDSPVKTRLTFRKSATAPGKSIRFGITHYEFGDTYAQRDELISNGSAGVGIQLHSNHSAGTTGAFSQQNITGEAPPGWEVELFRNGLFVEFKTADDNGQFVFENVELQHGENFFEIKKYSDQGEVEIEKRQVHIGQEMIKPGEMVFSATLLRDKDQLIGEPLIPIAKVDGKQPSSIAVNTLYGAFERHSFGIGYNSAPASGSTPRKDYAKLTWLAAYPAFSSRLDFAQDIDAGQAISFHLKGRVFEQSVNLSSRFFNDFSTVQSNYGNTKSNATLTLFGSIKSSFFRQLPYTLSLTATTPQEGEVRYQLQNRLSMAFGRTLLSNELSSRTVSDPDSIVTNGTLSLNSILGSFQLRTNIGYALDPKELTSASLSMGYRYSEWRIQGALNGSFTHESKYSVSLDLSRKFKTATLSLSASTDEEGDNAVSIGLDFGFAGQPSRPYLRPSQFGSAGGGTMIGHVFMDQNLDGEFNEGDIPLEGVKFTGRSSWSKTNTDKDGKVLLTGLSEGYGDLVRMDTMTLGDPYLNPVNPKFRVSSHPGALKHISIPVVEVTEVEGNAFLMKGERQKPIGGVTIGLFQDGELVKTAKTEFDGYYIFSQVFPGSYTASIVDPDNVMGKYVWKATAAFQTDVESGVTTVPNIIVHARNKIQPVSNKKMGQEDIESSNTNAKAAINSLPETRKSDKLIDTAENQDHNKK